MNTLQTGAIVEYGLAIGTIIEKDGEQHFQFALYDFESTQGSDPLNELCTEDMEVIGHIDADAELLDARTYNRNDEDVW